MHSSPILKLRYIRELALGCFIEKPQGPTNRGKTAYNISIISYSSREGSRSSIEGHLKNCVKKYEHFITNPATRLPYSTLKREKQVVF